MTEPVITPELLARVEAATGPDRELDTAIAIALRIGAEGYPKFPLGSFKAGYVQADMGRDGWSVGWHIQPLTASLDAALALVERVLPGWWWMLRSGDGYDAVLTPTWRSQDGVVGEHKTPALALLSAMLRALGTHEEDKT
jgi:hypothetical protein